MRVKPDFFSAQVTSLRYYKNIVKHAVSCFSKQNLDVLFVSSLTVLVYHVTSIESFVLIVIPLRFDQRLPLEQCRLLYMM